MSAAIASLSSRTGSVSRAPPPVDRSPHPSSRDWLQALPFLSSKCVEARAETTGVDPCGLVRGCVRSPDTPLMANLLDMANASLPDVDAAEARARAQSWSRTRSSSRFGRLAL
eukprot:666937-Pleurochrysis_carterae.AAC.1